LTLVVLAFGLCKDFRRRLPPRLGEVDVRNFLIAAGVGIAVTYGVDAFWFNGQYYDEIIRMFRWTREQAAAAA
jgi:multisubunit Na+/H+ antiporter MnhB subunit